MNLWGRKWSPYPIPPPSQDHPSAFGFQRKGKCWERQSHMDSHVIPSWLNKNQPWAWKTFLLRGNPHSLCWTDRFVGRSLLLFRHSVYSLFYLSVCVCMCVSYSIWSTSLLNLSSTGRRQYQLFSPVQLFATSWTVACQAPLSMGFSRQDYWSVWPFPPPGDLPNPGIEPGSLALQADSLPSESSGKAPRHQPHRRLRASKCIVNLRMKFITDSHPGACKVINTQDLGREPGKKKYFS